MITGLIIETHLYGKLHFGTEASGLKSKGGLNFECFLQQNITVQNFPLLFYLFLVPE